MEIFSPAPGYELCIWCPEQPPPAGGFPVVLVLDAGLAFTCFVECVRGGARRPQATGIDAAVVAGLRSVAPDKALRDARMRDYTAGSCADEADGGAGGGAEAFLAFIEKQVLPAIEQRAPVDASRRTLFGHSLAGYFCLWALARRPGLFDRHVAISPSVWWDPQALWAEPPVHTAVGDGTIEAGSSGLYVAVGEWEATAAPWQQAGGADPQRDARRESRRMVEQARSTSARFASRLPVGAVTFEVLPGEDHFSVVLPAVPRALRFMRR
ncbi:MAG: alpha/beta hydrolase-fold protein [Steroidobacteraceae bacterium]